MMTDGNTVVSMQWMYSVTPQNNIIIQSLEVTIQKGANLEC